MADDKRTNVPKRECNTQFLKPFEKGSERARECGRKGGIARAEKYNAKKTIAQYVGILLSLKADKKADISKLIALGLTEDDCTQGAIVAMALLKQAKVGNVNAINSMHNMELLESENKKVQNSEDDELTKSVNIALAGLAEKL